VNRRLPAALLAVAALTAVLVLGNGTAAFAATANGTDGAYSFTVDDTDVAAGATLIAGYTGGPAANIPATVTLSAQTYAVTGIGANAFSNKALTSVTIPDSVTSIGANAFFLNGLTTVTIPDSVTSIGTEAFLENALTTVTIPDSVTSIGTEAFASNHLTSVTLGDSVTSIGDAAFYENDLTTVTIPDSVTSIGDAAFANNDLTTVTIPDSVTNIGFETFYSNALTSVTIPDSVTSIGGDAFDDNDLTSVTIPDSVTSIGGDAFDDNDLTTVTIPDSVTSIGDLAFYNNSGLVRVEFDGAAPTTIGTATGGDSLGNAAGLTVYYNWAFDAARAAGGFTTPTWQGYTTVEQATVAFEASGHGTAPATQDVAVGTTATKPADPTAAGYIFNGWYTSPALTTLASFTDPVTANTTYYASWSTLALTGTNINSVALPLTGLTLLLGLILILIVRRKTKRGNHPGTRPLS
jgi:uncharacterized repeat protein (TIGR02543 family)